MPLATSVTSAPTFSHSPAISLMKLILRANKAFVAYLIISALMGSVVTNDGRGKPLGLGKKSGDQRFVPKLADKGRAKRQRLFLAQRPLRCDEDRKSPKGLDPPEGIRGSRQRKLWEICHGPGAHDPQHEQHGDWYRWERWTL